MFTEQSYLTDRPIGFQKVWFQESIKKVACETLNGVVNWQHMHPFSILDVCALQTQWELLAQAKPYWTPRQELLQGLDAECQPYLVHRHYISQPHSEVVSDNFVEADLRLLNSVISKNNANCVLTLFALRICWNAMVRDYLEKIGQLILGRALMDHTP